MKKKKLITGFLFLTLFINLGCNFFYSDTVARRLITHFSGQKDTFIADYSSADQLLNSLKNTNGNIFIDFKGFTHTDFEPIAALLYFRAVYLYYPRKVFVADPSQIITLQGVEFLYDNFVVTKSFLEKNKIKTIFTLSHSHKKGINWKIKRL
ncbi:MAG: hypothetical protein U9O87_00780 [Verrucomicrobiota bacterium]|nr:hypothetical protein [Verrucomicrobiota bacterium]